VQVDVPRSWTVPRESFRSPVDLSHNTMPDYASVQRITKRVLAEITGMISADSTERIIVSDAIGLLSLHGVVFTWYYDCPALVLLGARSCLSASGRDYQPSDELVGQTNLVTIDLSPIVGTCWGDCARSFVVENGRVTLDPLSPEFQRGTKAVWDLHVSMRQFAKPETRFCGLFHFANEQIAAEPAPWARTAQDRLSSCRATWPASTGQALPRRLSPGGP
jgi:hypothetical protein